NGYSLKDKNKGKTDKTGHRNGKSVKSRSQRRVHLKWANPYPNSDESGFTHGGFSPFEDLSEADHLRDDDHEFLVPGTRCRAAFRLPSPDFMCQARRNLSQAHLTDYVPVRSMILLTIHNDGGYDGVMRKGRWKLMGIEDDDMELRMRRRMRMPKMDVVITEAEEEHLLLPTRITIQEPLQVPALVDSEHHPPVPYSIIGPIEAALIRMSVEAASYFSIFTTITTPSLLSPTRPDAPPPLPTSAPTSFPPLLVEADPRLTYHLGWG
ncbi:hypothetical protein Tco_0309500, partial [Tanacetum coccineum]